MTIPVSDEVRRLLLEEAMHTRRRAWRVGSRQLVEEPVRGGIEPLEMLLAARQLAIPLRTGSNNTAPPGENDATHDIESRGLCSTRGDDRIFPRVAFRHPLPQPPNRCRSILLRRPCLVNNAEIGA